MDELYKSLNTKKEKIIRELFRIGLYIKWFVAFMQILCGFLFISVNQNILTKWIAWVVQKELIEDPRDYIATFILQFATHLSFSARLTIAIYLLSHGLIKFVLVYGLWKDKLAVYPISAGFSMLFMVYQIYRYQFTHSIWLIWLSAFDIVYIYLILHEYGVLKRLKKAKDTF